MKQNGIQWTSWSHLNEFHFTDDITLLSHNQQQMQGTTSDVVEKSSKLGLNIHRGKRKLLKTEHWQFNTNQSGMKSTVRDT